jgi:D-alanyl-D-alanine carboxypeptidase
MSKYFTIGMFLLILSLPLTACSIENFNIAHLMNDLTNKPIQKEKELDKPAAENSVDNNTEKSASEQEKTEPSQEPAEQTPANNENEGIPVVANPESVEVLVNKQNMLPENYNPTDLVNTNIPFVFKEQSEKRMMRSEAAAAINTLFTEANKQGISLLGVSAYRSHATQVSLFNYYVTRDGYEKARTYSALPGTSEHETGLSIDVTGGDGQCAAMDCFGSTKEAAWLQAHAAEYGFIIRFPKGKEAITGYQYEPWHLRYVGVSLALDIMGKGITLEEYFNAVPVTN